MGNANADAKPAEPVANRDEQGRFGPGNCANPGGRPKSLRRLMLEAIGEKGMERFAQELAKNITSYSDGAEATQDVMWFLEREYPKVSHVNVADTTQRQEQPKVDDTDELVSEADKMLANLASPSIESDLPVQPGTEVTKQ